MAITVIGTLHSYAMLMHCEMVKHGTKWHTPKWTHSRKYPTIRAKM